MKLEDYIKNVPNFPIEGIQFKDITPLLNDKDAFKESVNQIAEFGKKVGCNLVMGPESRGFIFGCPVAIELNTGFVPIRKPGKLPRKTVEVSYDLEYGKNTLCIHEDSIKKNDKVLIIDDLLATGGTLEAAIELVEKLGGVVVGIAVVIELVDLNGKEKIKDIPYISLIKY